MKNSIVRTCMMMLLIAAVVLSGKNPLGMFPNSVRPAAASSQAGTVDNGGFETVSSPAHAYGTNGYYWKNNEAKPWSIWPASGTPEYTAVSDVKHSGNRSLRITHTTNARSSISQDITGVSAGGVYRIGMWIKTANVVEKVLPRIQFINDAGAKVGNIYYGTLATFTGTNDWSYTETTLTIPSGATAYRIEIFLGANGTTQGTAWVDDVRSTAVELEAMRQDWFNRLTGGAGYNLSDPAIASYINNIAATAQARWASMDQSPGRTALWADMANPAQSWNITWAFEQLRNMALAYHLEGSALYHNSALKAAIIDGIDFMYANKYNENTPEYNNWFHWQISGPQALNDLLILMYDDLTQDQINNYMRAIDYYVPEPGHKGTKDNPGDIQTGANLTDRVMVVALRGIIGNNIAKVVAARDAISPVFPYVTSGDGFYEDGSFIQHGHIAYIGGYGGSLLKSLSNVLNLLDGTSFEVTDPNLSHVWDWIPNSYEPFIHKGGMMDMVKGRSFGTDDHVTGRGVIVSLLRLLDGMPAGEVLVTKRMIKEWVLSDTTFANYFETTEFSISEIIKLREILNDSSIVPRGDLIKSKVFPAMANAVHLRPGFSFAVSMFSNTISSFENGNGQNLNGWYTGTGMTYLYNNDLTQYTNIEKTMDMLRLPGTTTDGTVGVLQGWKLYPNPKTWVGGSTLDGLYSSVGMDFSMSQNTGSALSGKKSWFMLGDKMVALGSGITGSNGQPVETIIENRQLNSSGNNILTVNGTAYQGAPNWSNTFNGVNWAHLQGNVPGSDIGYYFPTSSDLYGLREKKEGTTKIFPSADAYVGDGNHQNNNYGSAPVAVVRSNGTSYNYESYFKFDLSAVQGNITSAKVRLYPTGSYAGATANYAEIVSNNWTESGVKWTNKPASTGNVVGSWDPAKGTWVTIDVTSGAQSAQAAVDKNISLRVYPDSSYVSTNDTTEYAAREHTTTSWRPYLEIVTDASTDTYQSLAFKHGINPANKTYTYAVLPNKTAGQMASYASNPDITILENSTDVHAVRDESLNVVGANFWNDGIQTVDLITSNKKASITTMATTSNLKVSVSDPTKLNTGTITVELDRTATGVESKDNEITILQLAPTIKFTVNVNGAKGRSFEASFSVMNGEEDQWHSKLDFNAGTQSLGSDNTGVLSIEYDVTPLSNNIDGVMGYADSSTTVTAYSHLAMIVRMYTNGYFDARDGDDYAADASVGYTANTTYHVEIEANLPNETYDVWITPEGGSTVQIANDYTFRTDAPVMNDLGQITLRSHPGDYLFKISNHTVESN